MPGRLDPTRRLRPAAARPGPGRRFRRLDHPRRDEPDPERRRLMPTSTRRSRRGAKSGRDMAALLSDFGHDLPTIPPLAPEAKEPRIFKYAPRRGSAPRGRGWAP